MNFRDKVSGNQTEGEAGKNSSFKERTLPAVIIRKTYKRGNHNYTYHK